MVEKFFEQENWDGGLADSLHTGLEGCVYEGVGVDILSEPGILKVSQALTKESGSVVASFCKCKCQASDGYSYWGGDDGKIYRRSPTGSSWVKVHDESSAILDIVEFDGYIRFTTATALKSITVSNASSESTWSSISTTGTLTSSTYHPLLVHGLYLFIGNNRNMASVDDAGTFTSNGTPDITFASLLHNHIIKCLGDYGDDVLIGTEISTSYATAKIFRWDTVSPTYNLVDEVNQNGINAIMPSTESNIVFVQAGTDGTFYQYDGEKLEPIRQIRGNYENKTMTIHPNSWCNFKKRTLFGISNLSGDPCLEGVWMLGRRDINYNFALMLEYVISQNKTSAIEIGAMLAIGNTLLVAWKDGTTYGVDVIDWTAKYASAYVETIVMGESQEQNCFEEYALTYKSLPTGTALALSYYDDYASSATSITLDSDTDYKKYLAIQDIETATMRFKIGFTVNGNNAPELRKFYSKWNDEGII